MSHSMSYSYSQSLSRSISYSQSETPSFLVRVSLNRGNELNLRDYGEFEETIDTQMIRWRIYRGHC